MGGVDRMVVLLGAGSPASPSGEPLTSMACTSSTDALSQALNAGQLAEVKLETFPYTRYGSVDATVNIVTVDGRDR